MNEQSNGAFYWFNFDWFNKELLTEQYEYQHPIYLKIIPYVLGIWLLVEIIKLFYSSSYKIASPTKKIKFDFSSLLMFIPKLFFALTITFILIALSRPQKVDETVEQWTEGIDIALVIDVSYSMKGMDLKPDRLEATKKVAVDFINGRFQDRIGIVIFASEAYSKSPLTTDYDMLRKQVEDIAFGDVDGNQTAIGSALGIAVNRMQESPAKNKVIILLSDGESNAGNVDPLSAVRLAYSFDMKVYTIGVGKEGKVPYEQEVADFFGNVRKQVVYQENNFDEHQLKEIAKIGKGKYFRASDNKALASIFEQIDEYEKTEIKEERYKSTKDYYQVYLYWALLCFGIWLFFKNTFFTNSLID